MYAESALESFKGTGVLPELAGCRFIVDGGFQFGIFVNRAIGVLELPRLLVLFVKTGKRDTQLVRDHFCEPVRLSV